MLTTLLSVTIPCICLVLIERYKYKTAVIKSKKQ